MVSEEELAGVPASVAATSMVKESGAVFKDRISFNCAFDRSFGGGGVVVVVWLWWCGCGGVVVVVWLW